MCINNLFCEIFVLSVPTEAQNDKTDNRTQLRWTFGTTYKMKIYMQIFKACTTVINYKVIFQ